MSILDYGKNIAIGGATIGAATAASTYVGGTNTTPQEAAAIGAGIGAIGGAVFTGGKGLSTALKARHGFSSLAKKEDRTIALAEDRLLNLTGDKAAHLDRKAIVANTAGELYINSINNHVIQPAINTVKNLATGKFNNISASDIAATAVAGYGLYEAGEAVKSAGEGDFSSSAISLASFGASKMLYMGAKAGIEKGIALHKAGESIPKHMKDYVTGKDGLRRDANDLKLYGGLGYVWSKKVNPVTEYMSTVGSGGTAKSKVDNIKAMTDSERKTLEKQIQKGAKYSLEFKELAGRRHKDEYSAGYNQVLSKAQNGKMDAVKNNIEIREKVLNEKVFSDEGVKKLENADALYLNPDSGLVLDGNDMLERVENAADHVHKTFNDMPGGINTISKESSLKERAFFTMMHPDVSTEEYEPLVNGIGGIFTTKNKWTSERTSQKEIDAINQSKDEYKQRMGAFLSLGLKGKSLGIEIDNTGPLKVMEDYMAKTNVRKGSGWTVSNRKNNGESPYGFKSTGYKIDNLPPGSRREDFTGVKDTYSEENAFRTRKIKATEEELTLFKRLRTGWRPSDGEVA